MEKSSSITTHTIHGHDNHRRRWNERKEKIAVIKIDCITWHALPKLKQVKWNWELESKLSFSAPERKVFLITAE